ncbi:DUF4097 domain-containing protein [Aestuariibacter halophilus]|uniref:DUF4097 domain-containing protein n=1 Tax=Fluctibacter halophilus TaxID=226011 RepID=A0ABS8GAU3_9ALTE|nr:DUF4097 family beta strand repeat-containing protein [Aestuariibacter halophilus]MCC2616935.1 DUF4097 domain-containing protein [Aestuariibacter halophilus]
MNTQSVKKPLLCAAALLFSSTCLVAHADQQYTFDVAQGGTLHLKTDVGALDVDTHGDDSVEIEVLIEGKDADDFAVDAKQQGNDVWIRGEVTHGHRWRQQLKVRYTLRVPHHYDLDLKTAGGGIDIADLRGNIQAHTSGGSISIGSVQGNVNVHTSGGSIRTDKVDGQIDAHTSGGSITVTFASQPTQDAELHTSGGSITAYLPSDVQLDVNATTSGGRVRSDFDVDGRVKKQAIRGTINGGGPRLKLHTSGGSVSLKEH